MERALGEANRRAAAPPKCRGCGATLTAENDSAAHVIPNALGGRLKPKGIICQACNTALDDAADNALVEAFGAWPTLLDIPRDRGANPPKDIDTDKGRRVRLQRDGSSRAIDVKYEVEPITDGHALRIGAGDFKTVENLLKRARRQFSQVDVDAAMEFAREKGAVKLDDALDMSVDFSPQAVFGGVITAIWLYLIHETGRAFMEWDRLLECLAKMQKTGGTFRYFVDGLPGLTGPMVDLGHKIVARSVPSTGELITYVEILGVLRVGGVFAKADPPAIPLQHIYVYDLQARSDRSVEFAVDAAEFDRQDWSAVGLGVEDADALKATFKQGFGVLEEIYRRRFQAETIGDTEQGTAGGG